MDLVCETEIPIQNEHALCFSLVSKPVPVLDYLKAISTLVGASHILAVYEENDTIKVYFDEKKFMDAVIKTGIHVKGQHVKIEYAVPPGIKIFLSNIDPVITNMDLMALMSNYGSVVSPIIRMPMCEDPEFCHIDYGVRYVYMELAESLPNKLEIKYADRSCLIKISLNYDFAILPSTKLEDIDSSDSEFLPNFPALGAITAPLYGDDQVPVVVSVQSASSEVEIIHPEPENAGKRPARRRRRFVKTLRRRRPKLTATSRAARKIKQNVKYKLMGKKHVNNLAHLNDNEQMEKILSSSPQSQPNTSFNATNGDIDSSTLPLLKNDASPKSSSYNGLSDLKLKMFIKEVKFRRVPSAVLNKYLGDNYDNDKLLHLIEQLKKFNSRHKCNSLKIRISRLINTLKKTL